MANAKANFVILIFLGLFCLSWQIKPSIVDYPGDENHIVRMQHEIVKTRDEHVTQRASRNVRRSRRSTEQDEKCQIQETAFNEKLASVKNDFAHVHFFDNETKSNMALIWVKKQVLIVVTEENLDYNYEVNASPSNLYRSDEDGKVFTDITSNINQGNSVRIKKMNGLQKNGNQIFLVLHGSNIGQTTLMVSNDVGNTFRESTMPFSFNGRLNFHMTRPEYILAFDTATAILYLSTDTGRTWKNIKNNCVTFRWSTWDKDPPNTIYVSSDPGMTKEFFYFFHSGHNILEKSIDGGNTWHTLREGILSFGLQNKFIYASVKAQSEGHRYMEVSTDGGDSWDEVQLPTIAEDRFYSILDMSEGQIFMHVDDPGDTGVGTIYTSDASGIVFSESLKNHLFPNFEDVTDFYKVNSMRGVYICSQLDLDASIHTLISRDRGAKWSRIKRPEGIPCVNEEKECYLQIHYKYSVERGVKSPPPKSIESAVGIIIVHGHVANALQITEPDLYVSDDGGYTWRLSLKGPHYNEIADQGGLLVAIAEGPNPKIIKFSTDEGNCWHEYKFTDDDITFTGLLTEPGNKAMSVAIWAYGTADKQWRVYIIDFEKVIDIACTDSDYVQWTAHSDNKNDGCLLGRKDTFQRLKPDSWCLNGHSKELSMTYQICPCTKDDYDCDYGYMREVGTDKCITDTTFKAKRLDICKRGSLEELVYEGYHKIPGDVCSNQNGFHPATDSIIKLKERCKEGNKLKILDEEGLEPSKSLETTKKGRAVLVITVLSVFAVISVLVVFLVKKYKHLKQSKLVYRYSKITTDEQPPDDLEHALGTATSLYEDSSDEENTQTSHTANRISPRMNPTSSQLSTTQPHLTPNGSVTKSSPPLPQLPQVKSYHDDSDEDMLE